MLRDGKSVSTVFTDAPELRVGLQLYLEAFFDLDSDRTHHNGLTPIPWSAIKDYAVAHELDEELTADLFYFIRFLDNSHMKRLAAKVTRTDNGTRPKPPRKPARPPRKAGSFAR